MLLLFEGGSDCIRRVATHLEEEDGNCNSAGEVQNKENKVGLQAVLLLQEEDSKPIPQNQFITDLLTFDLHADLPEVVGIISTIKMKTLQHIYCLRPKFTKLTNTAGRLAGKDGEVDRSTDNKAANQQRRNDSRAKWKCVRNFPVYIYI